MAREEFMNIYSAFVLRTFKKRKPEVAVVNGFGLPLVSYLAILIQAMCLVFVGTLNAKELGPATKVVKETIDQVLTILDDPELKDPQRADERRDRLEKVIGQRFDYEEMGKRTLAAHWKKLDAAQQKEFVRLFQKFLSNSYAGNLNGYSGEKVEYLKERHKGDFAEVQTKVVSSKSELPLDYRLLKKNGDYRVYDVVIDGVSLMKNYRGQFARIIKTSSYDGLLEKLRTKADQISERK